MHKLGCWPTHWVWTLAVVGCFLVATAKLQAETVPSQFPRPVQLEPDVLFWQRIYSKVTTQGGLLHDDRYLGVVYSEVSFPTGASTHDRVERVDEARSKIQASLRKLATGPLTEWTDEDRRIRALFADNATPATFLEALDHVRFQLGQADRFREGVIRSGTWERHVEETLRREGLPGELSALPHVESSFNPRAYSKVGAAGLWQFMRPTGGRWLHIDNVVDERLDPYKSTVAAAQFLAGNYASLGTWPLALTAYNHGASGMRRAKEQLGTDDIVTILRGYQSKTFGFASRNFYVSFLAALEIDRHAEQYFGPIERRSPEATQTIRLPYFVPMPALSRAIGGEHDALKNLNLALLSPVWSGRRYVPKGFELRVPANINTDQLLTRLTGKDHFSGQPRDPVYRVRTGDTIEKIALAYDVSIVDLASYNRLRGSHLKVGTTLKIPPPPAQPIAAPSLPAQSVANSSPVPAAIPVRREPSPPKGLGREESGDQEPGPAPGMGGAASADPSDYSVTGNAVIVQATETLAQFATWLGVSAARLEILNKLSRGKSLNLGDRLRLDFSNVDVATFEKRRLQYHLDLQEAFFRQYQVVSRETIKLGVGDSLWAITHRYHVPVWLLKEYNPDLDLNALRLGREVVMPKVTERLIAAGDTTVPASGEP